MTSTKKWCHSTKDVPEGEHWAIIEFGSTYIADDGYGSSGSVPKTDYIAFTDHNEWEQEIMKRLSSPYGASSKDNFVAIKVCKAGIRTTHQIVFS